MLQKNISLIFGSFFGLTAVILGAFGTHYLSSIFTASQINTFDTAVKYQMYHALILCILGFFDINKVKGEFSLASYSFIAGIIIFSGSLYLYCILNEIFFAIITPIGGIFLIAGWFLIFYKALFRNTQEKPITNK